MKKFTLAPFHQDAVQACWMAVGCSILAWFCPMALGQSSRVDSTFDPGTGAAGGIVETVLPQPDGKVLICGDFTSFNGVNQGYIARLNHDGSVDPSFHAGPGYWVRHMALQPDGKIVIGGFFTNVDGVKRNRIARLNADGSLDTSFDPGLGAETKIVQGDDKDPFVFAVAVQPDGKILIAGNFRTYNGTNSFGIARINSDGSLDTSFKVGAGFDSWGRFLLLLPNNQILATGWFTSYDHHPYNRMVRLNSDGSADTSFNPNFGDKTAIYGAVLLPGGNLIAGGHSENDQGLFHQEFARLNPDGTFNTSYQGRSNEKTEAYYLQPDGKLIIGGYFSTVDGVSRNGLARVNPDGTLDESFKAEADNFVWTIRGEADGNILVCGGFYHIDGIPRGGVARILITDVGTPISGTSGGSTNGNGTVGSGTSAGGGTSTGDGTSTGGNGSGASLSPQLQQVELANGSFRVKALTAPGHEYLLQFRTLESERWLSLPTLTGDGTVKEFVDSNTSGSDHRFYRLLVR